MHAGVTDELLAKYGRLPRRQTEEADGVADCSQDLHPPSHSACPEVPPPGPISGCFHPALPGTEDDDGLTLELPKPKKTKRGRPAKHTILLQDLMQGQRRAFDEQNCLPMDAVVELQGVEDTLPERAIA